MKMNLMRKMIASNRMNTPVYTNMYAGSGVAMTTQVGGKSYTRNAAFDGEPDENA